MLLILICAFIEFAVIAHVLSVNIPTRDALTIRTGKITDARTATQFTDDVVFKIDGRLPEYKYVDWYPNFPSAERNIVNGNAITVHTSLDGDTIWSVTFDDGSTTSFEKMTASRSRNKFWARVLAIVMPFVLALSLFDIWRKTGRDK